MSMDNGSLNFIRFFPLPQRGARERNVPPHRGKGKKRMKFRLGQWMLFSDPHGMASFKIYLALYEGKLSSSVYHINQDNCTR